MATAAEVKCPECGQEPGAPCRNYRGAAMQPHRRRKIAAREKSDNAQAIAAVRSAGAMKREREGRQDSPIREKLLAWASAPPRGPFPSRFVPAFEWKKSEEARADLARASRLNTPPGPGFKKCSGFRDCGRWLAPEEAVRDDRCNLCQRAAEHADAEADARRREAAGTPV